MPNKTYRYPISISIHNIDAAGVMFFADYFRLAHDAYEAFMAEIGFPLAELIRQRTRLPLVHSEADFLQPVRHGDSLSIELHLQRIGTSSFTVSYRFLDTQEQEAARLITTHVLLDHEAKRPMDLPETMHKALSGYVASTQG